MPGLPVATRARPAPQEGIKALAPAKGGSVTPLLGIREAAQCLDCSDDTIRRIVHAGELPCIRLTKNGPMKFDPLDLEAFKEQHKTGARRQAVAPLRVARG